MSYLKKYDTNQNGTLDPNELLVIEIEDRRRQMLDNDKPVRAMAWYALAGLLCYPAGIFLCSLFGLDKAAELIADIAGTYFIAVAGLVASFFAAGAYQAKKQEKSDK
jgi:hypothetical protein